MNVPDVARCTVTLCTNNILQQLQFQHLKTQDFHFFLNPANIIQSSHFGRRSESLDVKFSYGRRSTSIWTYVATLQIERAKNTIKFEIQLEQWGKEL
jgi:hypothetical protein